MKSNNNILTSFVLGRMMAGPDLSGHEAAHQSSMRAMETEHNASMQIQETQQKIEKVFSYASNTRMRLQAYRQASSDLIADLQKANVNIDKEAFQNKVRQALNNEYEKTDDQIAEETVEAIRMYHQPDDEAKS